MARDLLPIRMLFHATFAFVYIPIMVLGFTWGLSLEDEEGFVSRHFDGVVALAALIGLGIFAALDILTIARNVNQRAFLAIEFSVVLLMPLPMLPIIIACIFVIFPDTTDKLNQRFEDVCPQWLCNLESLMSHPVINNISDSSFVIAATVAILGLNAAFVSYICIAATIDKVHGNQFLPIYPAESSPSSKKHRERWHLFGTQRTPAARAAVVRHCADYMFQHSVFRKHAFEPTPWAVLRGIIAVYSYIGLVVFSAYSGYIQFRQYSDRAYNVNDAILASTLWCAPNENTFDMTSITANTATLTYTNNTTSPPTFVLPPETNYSVQVAQETWVTYDHPPAGFEIGWNGSYILLTWVTIAETVGSRNSMQVNLTSPLILAPFKQYSITLSAMRYIVGSFWFISYRPDIITSVDSAAGSNTSLATFSFNDYCHAIIQRELTAPSFISEVAHVLSSVGGAMASIDGLFALIFGRTIVAILFGARIISPFGLLGMVTHNRFKRLIHEQYPRMQEDIDRGGMAAYISEVAIDAALVDSPSAAAATGHTPAVTSSRRIGDAEEGRESAELRRRQTGNSSASYPRMSSVGEDLGDSESIPLVAKYNDDE